MGQTSTPSDGPLWQLTIIWNLHSTSTDIDDVKHQPQLSDQPIWNSDKPLLKEWQKTLFGCKNGHFYEKGPKVDNKNSFIHQYNETWPYNILEKMTKNFQKHHIVTSCNVFLTKGPERPKQYFFLELTLSNFINRPEIKFKYAKLRNS